MRLIFNSTPEIVPGERRTHDNREFIVAPVVMVVEGVMNGELALAEEFGKYPAAWNGIPFVLGHPEDLDGTHISAKDPAILAEVGLGQFFHATIEDNAVKGEVWLDVAKAEVIGGDALEVLRRLEAGEPLEVSSAYFTDLEDRPGEYHGTPYRGVQRNFRPDHLAALPNDIGACSWEDGCGAPRINQEEGDTMPYPNEHAARLLDPEGFNRFRRENDKFGDGVHAIWGIKGEGDEEKVELQSIRFDKTKFTPGEAKEWLEENDRSPTKFEEASGSENQTRPNRLAAAYRAFIDALTMSANELGSQERRRILEAALVKQVYASDEEVWPYIQEVFSDRLIVDVDRTLLSFPYSVDSNGAVTFGEPTEVVASYYPISQVEEQTNMDEKIKAILEDGRLSYNEDELKAMSEETLDGLLLALKVLAKPEGEPAANEDPVEEGDPTPAPPQANSDEPCGELPAELQQLVQGVRELGGSEVVLNRLRVMNQQDETERARIVGLLVANEACQLTQEQLESMGLESLQALHRSFAPADYSGQGGEVVANAGDRIELVMPSIIQSEV